MRRIITLVVVAFLMAAMMVATALPVFAEPNPKANCIGETASVTPENIVEGAKFSTPGPFGIGAAASSDCDSR